MTSHLETVVAVRRGEDVPLEALREALLFYAEKQCESAEATLWRFMEDNDIALTMSQRTVLATLFAAPERAVVPKERLYRQLYDLRLDPPDPKIIDVMICKIRHHTQRTRLEIETVWGIGYRYRWLAPGEDRAPAAMWSARAVNGRDARVQ